MNDPELSEIQVQRRAKRIVGGFLLFVLCSFVYMLGYSIYAAYKTQAEALASIKIGARTRASQEMKVLIMDPDPLTGKIFLYLHGVTCKLDFGSELEVVGVHQGRVLLRNLSSPDQGADFCREGTLFFQDTNWYFNSFQNYDWEFERRQKIRLREEEDRKVIRNLLLAEQAIKH